MDNQTLLNTLAVLRQLDSIAGMSLKFTYACVRNITAMEKIEKTLQKLEAVKLPGQVAMEEAKRLILEEYAKKDDAGKSITTVNAFNQPEYDIADWEAFEARMDEFKEEYADLLEQLDQRHEDMVTLMKEEVEDFEPYLVDMKYLPLDDKGNCRLSPVQLRHVLPFLSGDLDDLPESV
jgi:uncharacterized coiled-coil DUF342 family protein